MLSQLKSFLNRFSRKSPEQVAPPETSIPAPNIPKPAAPVRPATAVPPPAAAKPRVAATPPAAPVAAATSAALNVSPDEVINLPTRVIVSRLPAALSALVKAPGDGNIALPAIKVLEQLPKGSVKVSFAELRQAAPPGTFLDVTSQDQTLVELPLPEILSRVNPEHLKRKPAQRQVEVPAEVGNVFGPRGEQLPQPTGDTGVMRKPAAPAPARPATPVKPVAPAPKIATSIPVPAAKAPAPAPIKVAVPGTPKAAPAPAAAPQPALKEAPSVATDQTQFFLKKEAVAAGEVLTVPLASISENWPQNIKQEIAAQKLTDSSVALPMAKVEAALKTGRIIFGWQEVGSWLRPTPFNSTANADAALELPLKVIAPLFISQHRPISPQKKVDVGENIPDIFAGGKLKAPAPVMEPPASQAPAAPAPVQPKPVAPAPAPAAAPTPIPAPSLPKPPGTASSPALPKVPTPMPPLPKAAPTAPALPKLPTPAAPKPAGPIPVPLPKAAPAVAPASAPAPVAEKEPQSLGELFGDPGKSEWSPKDVVQATNKLKGVAGSMVSLSDGLMVAGELPAPFRAETTAAFLPQIFGRMGQYAKELHLGDMNVISFECQKAPLIIYKSGMVFFGVLGRAGEPLPLSQIRFIAAELAKQNK